MLDTMRHHHAAPAIRGRSVRAVALALACTLGLAVSPALAVPSGDITISVHSALGCPPPAGCTFAMSGVLTDSGPITTEFLRATALPSPVVGTAQYVRTFHGQQGSLTIRLESRITAGDEPFLVDEVGHWVLVSGTGAYDGLVGQGTEAGIRNFATNSLDAVYSGRVH